MGAERQTGEGEPCKPHGLRGRCAVCEAVDLGNQVNALRMGLQEIVDRADRQKRTLTGIAGAESADEDHIDRAKTDASWIVAASRELLG